MAQSCTRSLALSGVALWLACASEPAVMAPSPDASITTSDASASAPDDVSAVATLRGEYVGLEITSSAPLYQDVCNPTSIISRRVGDAWKPLETIEMRFHMGFYIDDYYVTPTTGLGCDTTNCRMMDGTASAGPVVDVVAAGTREPPAWVRAENAARPAPVYESEPVSGLIRVELIYAKQPSCASFETLAIELEVPEDGVCCPIGPAGCGSDGPGGGWAPALDACLEWNGTARDYSEMITDSRGCPKLRMRSARQGETALPDCGA